MTATTAALTGTRLVPLVDQTDFRTLFVEELGWDNPDQPALTVTVEDVDYTLHQVAGFKGMRIWHCPELPGRRIQRLIDQMIAKDNLERLVIFTNDTDQEWRWPRRAQTGGVNAKLLVHQHTVGEDDAHLVGQLMAITIDFDDEPTLPELLSRMRLAFDVEAEKASFAAARLMSRLYTDLEASGVNGHDATLLLARLLFLLFGDDSGMWRTNMFREFLATHTTEATLHEDLTDLFQVLDTPRGARDLPAGSPLAEFRYVNGGLYRDDFVLPHLKADFRDGLLDACDFDWSLISPAIFGSMFQAVKDKEARREGGEHYTTEENILKTINPLFLDELRDRLDQAWDDKGQLTRLHNDLGRLRIMDPACGCGNFLIVAYRELRALELEVLKRRRDLDEADGSWARSQMSIDVTGNIQVTLDHFYGIEIEEWPARIAETAMLLVDHLANQAMEEEFGMAPDRLPIKVAPTIVHGNALKTDWAKIVPPSEDVIIVGNPPFIGISLRSETQTAELQEVWGPGYHGTLDYVTGWHAKALNYFRNCNGRWAFVTTNSITQGEVVAPLFTPIINKGWNIKFGHRTFKWVSEAAGQAAVHCVIVGFSKTAKKGRLFDYATPTSQPVEKVVNNITPYLTAGPTVIVTPSTRPLNPQLGEVTYGSKPTDGGWFMVSPDEYAEVMADPIAAKYVRKYVGARELLHGGERYCLWLVNCPPSDIRNSPVLRERVAGVRAFRAESKAASTRAAAETAHLFRQIAQPDTAYLCIPAHVSESRPYFLSARFGADTIASNANFIAADPDGFMFSIISSTMFITWQRAVGGRIKSDLRFNKLLTWNTFPLPPTDQRSRQAIIEAGNGVLAARELEPDVSLADLYAPSRMSAELRAAHAALDAQVDRLFGIKPEHSSELDRQSVLFTKYKEMSAPLLARAGRGRRR